MEKMYICNECGYTFERPKYESAESYYGCSGFDYDCGCEVGSCPYCGGDYEEAMECKLCEDNYVGENSDGICSFCKKHIIEDYANFVINNYSKEEFEYLMENLECDYDKLYNMSKYKKESGEENE